MLKNAELDKKRFVEMVSRLAWLRDLQYESDLSKSVVQAAEQVLALNLPSNLLRAAAIFVDFRYGFPPKRDAFLPPAWVQSTELLPEEKRGSLQCGELKEISSVREGDVVVLTCDLQSEGLHSGMAGIVKELPSDEEGDEEFRVEFGESDESLVVTAHVSGECLRPPRPGDLLENYRC